MTYTASTPRLGIVNITDVAQAASLGQPGIAPLPSIVTEPQFGEVVDGWDPILGGAEFIYARAAATVVTAQTISSITVAGTTATLTTGAAHGLVVGQVIQISGATPAAYNGVQTILTVPTTTTLTFTTTAVANATVVGTYVAGIGVGQVCELAYALTGGVLVISATPWVGTANTGKPLGISMVNLFPLQSGWLQVEGAAIANVSGTVTANAPVYYVSNGTLASAAVAGKQLVAATAATAAGVVLGSGATAVTLPAYQALVFINRPSAQDAIT